MIIWVSALRSNGKILHLFGWDKKFVPPFIDFVREHFDESEHSFIIYGPVNDAQLPAGQNIIYYPSLLRNLPALLANIRAARKIILHGLFSSHLFYALALQPWLLKKCYWTIWGGDLYIHNAETKDWRWYKNEWIRRFVIARVGHFITQIKGDYELARQWYGAKGVWHECFMYPSNLYHEPPVQNTPHEGINILVGNSADPSNNHREVLERLRPYAQDAIRIYCPLSYGDQNNAEEIVEYGKFIFGEKFVALREFIPFDEYLNLLAIIDVAIFNHTRQQGMGNITTLLGLGKKIFIRNEITSWEFFNQINVAVFDMEFIDIKSLNKKTRDQNRLIIAEYFSEENLVASLKEVFK